MKRKQNTKPYRGKSSHGGSFAGKSKFGSGEKFKATCAQCDKSCLVPFKPNGRKPVHCSDCFRGNGGSQGGYQKKSYNDRGAGGFQKSGYQKKRFNNDRGSYTRSFDNGNNKQMTEINQKLDRILYLLNSGGHKQTAEPAATTPAATPTPTDTPIETPDFPISFDL